MKLKSLLMFLIWMICAVFGFILLINASIYAMSKSKMEKNIADLEEAQVVLIPGAAIFSGKLSPVYEDRVKGAIELYKSKKVSKVLVSGDNSSVWYNEVSPVRDYLIQAGIPDSDIFLDHAGFDTYSSMYRAKNIFNIDSVIISSQAFHLPRSIFVARSLGLKAFGLYPEGNRSPIKNYFREFFASEKAIYDLMTGRKPKFLGEEIPIFPS